MKPKRIQRKRTKGYRMPKGAVYVGRPSKWGNPYPRKAGLGAYRFYVDTAMELGQFPDLGELRGKDLACWCRLDAPCHADILLELANR